jgi:hypothetical protein
LRSTKTRMIPTFLILAVVGVGAFMVWPINRGASTGREERSVVVTVTFEPSPRDSQPLTERVFIQVNIGDHHESDRATRSPWIRTYGVFTGQTVRVSAQQYFGGKITCQVAQVGHLAEKPRSAQGANTVMCRHEVT